MFISFCKKKVPTHIVLYIKGFVASFTPKEQTTNQTDASILPQEEQKTDWIRG
jgi:hypothetical protein